MQAQKTLGDAVSAITGKATDAREAVAERGSQLGSAAQESAEQVADSVREGAAAVASKRGRLAVGILLLAAGVAAIFALRGRFGDAFSG